jgi:POT family proton-dependent oligopeptide transporter
VGKKPDVTLERKLTFLGHPLGLLNVFSTEFCERFSYYGMRAILVFYLYDAVSDGGLGLSQTDSMIVMSLFGSLVYLSSIMGGWIADRILGPYRSILLGCILIASGHVVLGAPLGVAGLVAAIMLIVVGTGLLKPNVSVMVGSLYDKDDPKRLAGFSLLYLSINIGAFLSPIIVGEVSQIIGYKTGFLIPAVVMGAGLFVYVGLSKRTLAGVGRAPVQPLTPEDKRRWKNIILIAVAAIVVSGVVVSLIDEISMDDISDMIPFSCIVIAVALFIFIIKDKRVSAEERGRMKAYIPLFIAATAFFSISEQQSSTFAVVAKQYLNDNVLGFHVPASWFSSVNPLVIIVLSPVFAIAWTKLGNRAPSMVSKIGLGIIIAGVGLIVLSFGFFTRTSADDMLNPLWLIAALTIMTVGELFLSPTGLSATTLLAPKIHVSKVMGLWFISSALGQAINAATVKFFDGKSPEIFFMSYASIAIIIGIAVLLMRKRLLKLSAGVR